MAIERAETRYKRTDIGVIPSDWDVDEIQNHSDITTGSKNTQDRIEDGKYPFFVRSQKVERINTYSFDGEAVLTAGDGVGTGKVFHYINGKFDVELLCDREPGGLGVVAFHLRAVGSEQEHDLAGVGLGDAVHERP